jgi:hypothetical protein
MYTHLGIAPALLLLSLKALIEQLPSPLSFLHLLHHLLLLSSLLILVLPDDIGDAVWEPPLTYGNELHIFVVDASLIRVDLYSKDIEAIVRGFFVVQVGDGWWAFRLSFWLLWFEFGLSIAGLIGVLHGSWQFIVQRAIWPI